MRFGIPIHLLPKNSEEKEIKINIDYDAYILSLIKTGLSTENPALFKELFGKPTQITQLVYFSRMLLLLKTTLF